MPVWIAALTFSATRSGSMAKPPSKSALTGTSTPAAMARQCASIPSSGTPWSGRPVDHANPELVVATALNPSETRARAEPTSQGLGMTKHPDACSS